MRIDLPQLNKTIDVEKGENLFKALKANGAPIASSCNGDGVCGKCVISVNQGKIDTPNQLEQTLIEKYKLTGTQRISCQCFVADNLKISTSYW